MNFSELEQLTIKWATEREIFSHENGSNPRRQFAKLNEEFHELGSAIMQNDIPNVIDSLGDMAVVMILIARMYHTNMTVCLDVAYNEIKDRKGKMVNGLFVKEQ